MPRKKTLTQKDVDRIAVETTKDFIRKRFKKYVLWQMQQTLWEQYGQAGSYPMDEKEVCVAALNKVLAAIDVALKQVGKPPVVRRTIAGYPVK